MTFSLVYRPCVFSIYVLLDYYKFQIFFHIFCTKMGRNRVPIDNASQFLLLQSSLIHNLGNNKFYFEGFPRTTSRARVQYELGNLPRCLTHFRSSHVLNIENTEFVSLPKLLSNLSKIQLSGLPWKNIVVEYGVECLDLSPETVRSRLRWLKRWLQLLILKE